MGDKEFNDFMNAFEQFQMDVDEAEENGYKRILMKDKWKDHERENELKPWDVRKEEIVEAFRSEEKEQT